MTTEEPIASMIKSKDAAAEAHGDRVARKIRLDAARDIVARRLSALQSCALDDDRDFRRVLAAMAEAAVEFADLDRDPRK